MCVYVRIPAAAWPWRLLVCVYYCCLVFAVTLFAAIIVLYLFVSVWLAVHRMCRNVNCCCCFYCIRLFVYKHMNSYNIHIRNTYVCMHGVVVYTRYVIVFVMFVVPHQWPVCCCFCFLPSACLFYFFCVHRHRRSSFVIVFSFFFPHQIYTQMCIVYTYILSCIRHVYQPIAYFIPHRKRMMVIKQRQCMNCKWRAKKKILFGTICVCGAPFHMIYIYMLGFGPIVLLAYVFVCLSVCVCEWQRWNRGGLE